MQNNVDFVGSKNSISATYQSLCRSWLLFNRSSSFFHGRP